MATRIPFLTDSFLFIDAGCLQALLRYASEAYFGGVQVEIDYQRLRRGARKVFFYDALPVKKEKQDQAEFDAVFDEKLRYLDTIGRSDGYHVVSGDAISRKSKNDRERGGLEQKKVDILLAVDMLRFAHQGVLKDAVLMTSDLDFAPLIDALVAMGVDVTLLYQEGRTNGELIRAADKAIPMQLAEIHGWMVGDQQASFRLPGMSLNSPGLLHQLWFRPAKMEWEDRVFGQCRLVDQNGENWLLSRKRLNGDTNVVIIYDEHIARHYLKETHNFDLPRL